MITIIAAMTKDRVIGRDNALPWHLPADLKNFKRLTAGHTVLMGRKTFESIGKPLPQRRNIVVSRTLQQIEGAEVCASVEEGLARAAEEGGEVFVIGGAQVYAQALAHADRMCISYVEGAHEGDTHFPAFDDGEWRITQREAHEGFELVVYEKSKEERMSRLKEKDPKVHAAIRAELARQQRTINLIPSENYVSEEVLEATGSVLTNKYSEGYPGKRYYQGNACVDEVETLAIERAKQLFGAEHANVQPYSGSPANAAVFLAFLKPGDTFMGFELKCGGHLTHGSPVNFSGLTYKVVPYGVDEKTERLDMAAIRALALEHKPKLIISGSTAYSREIDFKEFQQIAEEVGAIHLADISHIAGLVAGGAHPSPFPFTDIVMTTTHKTLRGPRGAMLMCKEKYAKQLDKAVFPGSQGGPHDNVTAAKAVAFGEALRPEFKAYARQVVANAKALADALKAHGIRLVTDGTDNHLILVDLRPQGIGLGKPAAVALERAGIVTNCNTVPYDPSTPFKPSGVRIGTPMITTRGMKEPEMLLLGEWMASVMKDMENAELQESVRGKVEELCARFPIYKDL